MTFTCNNCYVNMKCVNQIYGISNNYIRLHGGIAVREHTRYKWYRKHKKR